MAKNDVGQKPSETALFAALRRAIAYKEFRDDKFGPDHLAEKFLPPQFRFFLRFKKVRENTKARLNEHLPGLNEYLIARTAYFDGIYKDALQRDIPQIVFLGAGYDSRPYRFEDLIQKTKIIEMDIAPTQNRKKTCLKAAHIRIPPQVSLAPIDFNVELLDNVLVKAGYNNQQETLFIWEGVSYYLDPVSVNETLEFISHSHPKSRIVFDYTVSISEKSITKYYGAKEFIQTMREQHGNEALLFSVNEGETKTFLQARGLQMVEHLDNEIIEERFLSNDSGTSLGQMTGHFRFVAATPA